jgi:hypothetical protein
MPSTYSPSLRIELIGAGEQSGTWGTTTNTNLGTLLEQSIAGVQAITMFDANYTLTNYNGVSDEARKAVLVVTGTNGAIRDIIAPLVTKSYTIKNNTTGGFAISIRAATGASVSIPNGVTSSVYCDGTNFQLALTQTVVAAGTGIGVVIAGAVSTVSIDGTVATLTDTQTLTNKTLTTPNLGTPSVLIGTNITGTAAGLSIGGNATTATNATTAANLNGTWTQMPAGTRVPFAQAAAPTGWTQDTTDNANNRMLRVVSSAGNGVGGSADPTLNNTVPYHTHGFTTGTVSADHTHNDAGHSHLGGYFAGGQNTGSASAPAITPPLQNTGVGYAALGGMTANHTHSGGTDGGSSQTNWTPRYINLIICAKS